MFVRQRQTVTMNKRAVFASNQFRQLQHRRVIRPALVTTKCRDTPNRLNNIQVIVQHKAIKSNVQFGTTTGRVIGRNAALQPILRRRQQNRGIVIRRVQPVARFGRRIASIVIRRVTHSTHTLHLPVRPRTRQTIISIIINGSHVRYNVRFSADSLPSRRFALRHGIVSVIVLSATRYTTRVSSSNVLSTLMGIIITCSVATGRPLFPTSTANLRCNLRLMLMANLTLNFHPLIITK